MPDGAGRFRQKTPPQTSRHDLTPPTGSARMQQKRAFMVVFTTCLLQYIAHLSVHRDSPVLAQAGRLGHQAGCPVALRVAARLRDLTSYSRVERSCESTVVLTTVSTPRLILPDHRFHSRRYFLSGATNLTVHLHDVFHPGPRFQASPNHPGHSPNMDAFDRR